MLNQTFGVVKIGYPASIPKSSGFFMANPEAYPIYCLHIKPYQSLVSRGCLVEGSLEVKILTTWTDGKAEMGRVRADKRRRRLKKKSNKKEAAGARKGRKVAIHCVFLR